MLPSAAADRGDDIRDRPLADRAGDVPGLAEAAAARAAAHDFDRIPVVDGFQVRDDRPQRRRRQARDDPLDDRHGDFIFLRTGPLPRRDPLDCAVGAVFRGIEGRNVHAPHPPELFKRCGTGCAGLFPLAQDIHQVEDQLLALADREGIEEIRHRFGVERAVSAADNQGMMLAARGGAQGDARQVQRLKRVGVERFIWKRDSHQVEIRHRAAAFEREERHPLPPHRRLHIGPRQEHPLGERVRPRIDDLVQDGQPEVRHADVVDVREKQRDPDGGGIPILDRLVQLAAGVAAGLFHVRQDAREDAGNFGGVHGIWNMDSFAQFYRVNFFASFLS